MFSLQDLVLHMSAEELRNWMLMNLTVDRVT